MTYAMVLASVGALLLSAPAFAAPSHGHDDARSAMASNDGDGHSGADRAQDALGRLLDKDNGRFLHNPHCDPDDRAGPDGDQDDHAANNPSRGRHEGRCNHPASP